MTNLPQRMAAVAACLGLALAAAPASAISLLHVDTFSGGSDEGWHDGGSPNPPLVIGTGGPAGNGDGYLRLMSTGGSGPGSRLSGIADADWEGNWTGIGVTAVVMDAINLGASTLQLRLYFDSAAGSALSSVALTLAANSGWTHLVFPVTPGALTGLNTAGTLLGVTAFRLFNNPDPAFPPPAFAGSVGIDNVAAVSAVPAPGSFWLWTAGLAALWPAARRRLSRRSA